MNVSSIISKVLDVFSSDMIIETNYYRTYGILSSVADAIRLNTKISFMFCCSHSIRTVFLFAVYLHNGHRHKP